MATYRLSALSAGVCVVALSTQAWAQQAATTTPRPSQPTTRATPQGFSVVLVLGDIQSAAPSDDVPPAARKALTDMRDFLPYKSFRLLDAAWLLCCGHDLRRGDSTSQMLRGPDGQEYELKLAMSRDSGGEFVVRFTLFGASEIETAAAAADGEASVARRLADARDRLTMIQVQLQEARKKLEVGTAPKAEVTKLEIEARAEQRRIDDLAARVSRGPGASTFHGSRSRTILDTTFTMDLGETVVVGTSRLKGGTKALIALLTAVPARGSTSKE